MAIASIEMDLQSLPDLTQHERSLIERAYRKAEAAHAGVFRSSGEPYFTHCIAVAQILINMHLDYEAIAAALLHDTVEDTDVTIDELRAEFGDSVAMIVDGVTKLTKLPIKTDNDRRSRNADRDMEYIRKMLLAMGDDVRVMLVKLADRLHNMRTLGYVKPEKQQRIARETLDIYAPIANRLGIWQFKWELEDLSLRYLQPDVYREIATKIDERRGDREIYLSEVEEQLRKELDRYHVQDVTLSGRPKHIYSIYNKMQRKGVPFDQVYDVRALRVIVDTIPNCYLVLGIVHNLWRPIPGEFDDYIAAPKENFYQSLHTAVLDSQGKTLEIQIRTWEMHEHAEYGIAAHWRYKEDSGHDEDFERRIAYLRRLMEFGIDEDTTAASFVDKMKNDVFKDRIYAFTPKGDIIDLPAGSTAIDFAYHIHTDIGHRCRGAKVHGKLVSLNYVLATGDQVEIIAAKRGGPSLDWLNPDLGYVNTARARAKIRHWFRRQDREKHITNGRDVLERELKRLGVSDHVSFEYVYTLFGFDTLEDFLVAVGIGDIHSAHIANRILEDERQKKEQEERNYLVPRSPAPSVVIDSADGISITGMSGLLVSRARCCNPMNGDEIVGYVTRGRGVVVHRADCPNLGDKESERLIEVAWESTTEEQRFSVPIQLVGYDRSGLMRDISTVIADEKINIADVNVSTRQNIATFFLTIEITNLQQLSRLLTKLSSINCVTDVHRRSVT